MDRSLQRIVENEYSAAASIADLKVSEILDNKDKLSESLIQALRGSPSSSNCFVVRDIFQVLQRMMTPQQITQLLPSLLPVANVLSTCSPSPVASKMIRADHFVEANTLAFVELVQKSCKGNDIDTNTAETLLSLAKRLGLGKPSRAFERIDQILRQNPEDVSKFHRKVIELLQINDSLALSCVKWLGESFAYEPDTILDSVDEILTRVRKSKEILQSSKTLLCEIVKGCSDDRSLPVIEMLNVLLVDRSSQEFAFEILKSAASHQNIEKSLTLIESKAQKFCSVNSIEFVVDFLKVFMLLSFEFAHRSLRVIQVISDSVSCRLLKTLAKETKRVCTFDDFPTEALREYVPMLQQWHESKDPTTRMAAFDLLGLIGVVETGVSVKKKEISVSQVEIKPIEHDAESFHEEDGPFHDENEPFQEDDQFHVVDPSVESAEDESSEGHRMEENQDIEEDPQIDDDAVNSEEPVDSNEEPIDDQDPIESDTHSGDEGATDNQPQEEVDPSGNHFQEEEDATEEYYDHSEEINEELSHRLEYAEEPNENFLDDDDVEEETHPDDFDVENNVEFTYDDGKEEGLEGNVLDEDEHIETPFDASFSSFGDVPSNHSEVVPVQDDNLIISDTDDSHNAFDDNGLIFHRDSEFDDPEEFREPKALIGPLNDSQEYAFASEEVIRPKDEPLEAPLFDEEDREVEEMVDDSVDVLDPLPDVSGDKLEEDLDELKDDGESTANGLTLQEEFERIPERERNVSMHGKLYLHKRSGVIKKWKPYIGVLDDKQLTLKPLEGNKNKFKAIQIDGILYITDLPAKQQDRELGFMIVEGNRSSWLLKCDTEAEKESWVYALNQRVI